MRRRISMVLAVVCLVLSISTVSAAAANEDKAVHTTAVRGVSGIQPYYINTANLSAGLKITGSTAYCYTEVFAKKTCFINVVMRLQRKEGSSWHTVSSWIESSANAGGKVVSKSFGLSTRGTYRVYAICTVGGEEVTCTSNTATY